MANLVSLTQFASNASGLANIILVSPQLTLGYQPMNPMGPDGKPQTDATPPKSFVFAYEGEQSLSLETDISDYYVQDNISVQDQISLKPPTFDSYGFVAEVDDVPPTFLAPLKDAANRLTAIGAYAPNLTITAQRAYNNAFFLYQAATKAVNSAIDAAAGLGNLLTGNSGQSVVGPDGLLTKGTAQNKQQAAFQLWYNYWQKRVLFNIQTPWAVFQNMAIKRIRAVQEAETNVITGFEVSFKQIRTVASITSSTAKATSDLQGRVKGQSAIGTNLGISSGSSTTETLGSSISRIA